MNLTNKQYAMVLAGLSLLHAAAAAGQPINAMEQFEDCDAVSPDEINDLCELINCGERHDLDANGQVSYRTLVLSLAHITKEDEVVLAREKVNQDNGMILGRDTGFFIKLYEDLEDCLMDDYSLPLKSLVIWAKEKGYSMIELDFEGPVMDEVFPTFDR